MNAGRSAVHVTGMLAIGLLFSTLPARGETVQFLVTQAQYDTTVSDAGIALHGREDFEDGNVPPNTGIGMDDPLDASSDNLVFSLGEILAGLRLQSNDNGTPTVNDAGASGPNPVGASGLVALGPGSGGAPDRCVGPTAFGLSQNSLDLIAIPATVRGIAFRVADLFTLPNTIEIAVFDRNETLIGETTIEPDGPAGVFVGIVICEPDIRLGRVNIWGVGPTVDFGGDEFVYEVTLHGDCPADLDGNGVVGFEDLLIVLSAWGQPADGPPDVDGSGTVDFGDLLRLLSVWGACA